ncbi:MAG: prepilin-type N-terminal cleavage/methylation domain-containing protein, partial [Lysobacterales bacterium]
MTKLIKFKNVKGFTIVEALIAFVVFSMGAMLIAVFLSRSLEMNADSEARTEALHLAKKSIAGFRNFATRDEVVAYTTDAIGNTVVGNNATFTRTWTVADVVGNDNAVILTVDVDWTGVNGAQNVSLESKIAKLKPERTGGFMLAK